MNKLKILGSTAVVGVVVALVYWVFEFVVHHSINIVWNELFNTEQNAIMIFVVCISLTLVFFGLQHKLDQKSEKHPSHGLGADTLVISRRNLFTVLLIGYFSLIAGASLGPEAILVPACLITGGLVGKRFFASNNQATKAMGAAAIIALFAAFFHSFIVGLLAIFLVKKEAKIKITKNVVVVAVVASAASALTLMLIAPSSQYFSWPDYSWNVKIADILIAAILVGLGYLAILVLKYFFDFAEEIRIRVAHLTWWQKGLVASVGLSILYLIGGPLVEFTGNESIQPLFEQAPAMGIFGLLWIFFVKLAAIGWSKSLGYRGGLIFPMIFVASVLVAISQQFYSEASFAYGLIGALIGIFLAERKAKILF